MEQIGFISDGTEETGAKIIKALESLGGINYYCLEGIDNDALYSISCDKTIQIMNFDEYDSDDFIIANPDDYINSINEMFNLS